MASLSRPRWFFSRCIASNASNSTFPTEICLRYRSGSRRRPDSIPLRFWIFRAPTRKNILLTSHLAKLRTRRETVTDLHRAEPTHIAANDFRPVHRDRTGRRPLFLGARALHHRWLQRRPGRPVVPQVAPADFAGTISGSHRRQAVVEHHVSCPFDFAQDSLE